MADERQPQNFGVVFGLLIEIGRLVAGVSDLADADHGNLLSWFLLRLAVDIVARGSAPMTSTMAATSLSPSPIVHEALVERRDAIEQRRRHADAVGEVRDHIEIVLQARHRALHRLEAALRHPRRADAELGRAAAAGGDRLDHQRHVDAGLEPERHGLRGRRDVDRDQKIVDELDAARRAKLAEIEAGIGEARNDHAFNLFAGVRVAGEIDHALARRHHARRAGDFAVDENGALLPQRLDLAFFIRHRMRAEFDHDLPRPRRLDEPMRAMHHIVQRCGRRQARKHDIRLGADIRRRPCRHPADLFEFGQRVAAIADDAVSALDEFSAIGMPILPTPKIQPSP